MSEYDNNNRGVLFANDKGDNKNRPDWKGRIDVNGQEYWLSGWIKDRNGTNEKYISLSLGDRVEPKEPPHQDTVADISDESIDMSAIPF
jgi:hypothetical protein